MGRTEPTPTCGWPEAGHRKLHWCITNTISLIETAKTNELNPYGYLKWVIETAPSLEKSDYSNLLPWNADRNEISRFALKRLRN